MMTALAAANAYAAAQKAMGVDPGLGGEAATGAGAGGGFADILKK